LSRIALFGPIAVGLALAVGSGCSKEVCADATGSCVALHLRSQTIRAVDQVSLAGRGLVDVPAIVTPSVPKRLDLPLDIAIMFRQAATGSETIHATAYLDGALVGVGDQKVDIVAGKHRDADLFLVATAGTDDDMSTTETGDMSPDLQATDLNGVVLVDITSPASDIYTHATSVPVQIAVSNAKPDTVELRLDGNLLATLTPPYQYTWDVSATPEGPHTLVARATKAGTSYDSAARTIVLDRTPPTVVSQMPTPGATNVSQGTTVKVTFSEPILASTVTDANVGLSSDTAATVSKTLTLSADGKALTIIPDSARPLGATLTVTLKTAITDLAGNSLALPTTPWKWLEEAFPIPITDGVGMTAIAVAVDASDLPTVAISSSPDGDENKDSIYVHRWTGTAWEALGGPQNPGNGCPVGSPQLLAGGTYLVYQESDPNGSGCGQNVYVKRWAANTWFDESPKFTDAISPRFTVANAGRFLATMSNVGAGVTVRKYNQTTSKWDPVGSPFLVGTAESLDDLIVDGTGNPVVAAVVNTPAPSMEHVVRWDGSSWVDLGALKSTGGKTTFGGTLATDSSGKIVAAFFETPNDYMQRWSGTAWTALGGALNPIPGQQQPRSILRSDPSGNLRLAVSETTGADKNLYMYKWDGLSAWQPIGAFASTSGLQYSKSALTVDSAGRPIIATYSTDGARVQRLNP
jgi:Bacterial Ig-like domain/Bacterial Ig domain